MNCALNPPTTNVQEISRSVATVPRQLLVACIDDSPQITQVMQQILTQQGYQFIGINEPLPGLPKLISSTPDLIFLDIGMPIVNGYEFCALLRRVTSLKNIPVVMLTGRDGIIDRMRAQVVGATNFLAKPIDTFKILDTIEKLLIGT